MKDGIRERGGGPEPPVVVRAHATDIDNSNADKRFQKLVTIGDAFSPEGFKFSDMINGKQVHLLFECVLDDTLQRGRREPLQRRTRSSRAQSEGDS